MISRLKKIAEKQPVSSEQRENLARNESTIIDLYFQLFKQYAWLGSAAGGAVVFMIQLKLIDLDPKLYRAVAAFAISIFLSILSQQVLVSELAKGKSIFELKRKFELISAISLGSLGFGVGSIAALISNNS